TQSPVRQTSVAIFEQSRICRLLEIDAVGCRRNDVEMDDVEDRPAECRRTAVTVVGIDGCRRKRKEYYNQYLSRTHPHPRLPPQNIGAARRQGLWNLTASVV